MAMFSPQFLKLLTQLGAPDHPWELHVRAFKISQALHRRLQPSQFSSNAHSIPLNRHLNCIYACPHHIYGDICTDKLYIPIE
jgi:hypothetical protein